MSTIITSLKMDRHWKKNMLAGKRFPGYASMQTLRRQPKIVLYASTIRKNRSTGHGLIGLVRRCIRLYIEKQQNKTFWTQTSLSFVFRGPNPVHPEVFRHANCNSTSFKAVWWSVSEKTHFGLKHHFPLYLEGQTQHTWGFQVCQLQWNKFQSWYS